MNPVLETIGVNLVSDWIDEATERDLTAWIAACELPDTQPYRWPFGRSKVLRFGHDYNDPPLPVPPVPPCLERFHGAVDLPPWDSVTINEYEPGSAISAHKDSIRFDDTISVLSLAGPATMIFWPPTVHTLGEVHDGMNSQIELALPRRSLLQIRGASRYDWKHSVTPVKALRYSIVFRKKL